MIGGCHCGNVRVQVELTREPDSYHPRACDCSFCRKHGLSYISDPDGSLQVLIKDEQQRGTYLQGSGSAEMLFCRSCGVVIGATYRSGERLYATLNVLVIEGDVRFGAAQVVSPQTLSPDEKAQRWQDLWFSKVTIR